MPTERELKLRCNFCGKTGREVWPMVEGPGDAAICHQCIDLCDKIARSIKAKSASGSCAFCGRPFAEVGTMTELMANTYLCLDCESRLVEAIRGGWKPS